MYSGTGKYVYTEDNLLIYLQKKTKKIRYIINQIKNNINSPYINSFMYTFNISKNSKNFNINKYLDDVIKAIMEMEKHIELMVYGIHNSFSFIFSVLFVLKSCPLLVQQQKNT